MQLCLYDFNFISVVKRPFQTRTIARRTRSLARIFLAPKVRYIKAQGNAGNALGKAA
jgi:hypothetical protein